MLHAPTEHLRHVIDHASHLLPSQWAITVFIHHNTLHRNALRVWIIHLATGTLGFVAAVLIIDGAVGANLLVGIGLLAAGAINGIAVVRAYLDLFTGTRHHSTIFLGITFRKRFAVLTLTAILPGGGLIPQYGVNDRYLAAEAILMNRAKNAASPTLGDAH